MKVKAKNWLNVGGKWYPTGEIFEIASIAGIEESVEVIAEPESDEPKPEPETQEETTEVAPKKRGRTKKQV